MYASLPDPPSACEGLAPRLLVGQTGAWLEYWQGGSVRLVNFECTAIYIAPTANFVGVPDPPSTCEGLAPRLIYVLTGSRHNSRRV